MVLLDSLQKLHEQTDLSERDTCTKFIGPAVKRAGWDEMVQMREEVNPPKSVRLIAA
jgi:type I site-specific restriction endonuclease